MSTTVEPAPGVVRATPQPLFRTSAAFIHAVTHVFLPVELPQDNYCTNDNDLSLAVAACTAAHAYARHVHGTTEEGRWLCITKMLYNLLASVRSEHLEKDHIIFQLRGMKTGGIITFFVRPHNAAIIVTKRENSTAFEMFEVIPSKDAVEETPGSLISSYPRLVIEMPNKVFDDKNFQSEFAHLFSLSGGVSDPHPPLDRLQHISASLIKISQGVGRPVDVTAISKRIRDNFGCWPRYPFDRLGNWRRCALWLLIRVAIQMSVERSSVGRASYKRFLLYFLCGLARDRNYASLPSDFLHLMSSKIFRRLSKLGESVPGWLSKMALETCARLRDILDARWNKLSLRRSPFNSPTQEELARDTKLLLQSSGRYIRKVISTPDIIQPRVPFVPRHRPRGTLLDFLSLDGSFFDEAYRTDPEVTIYDVEQSVEREIDDWVARFVHMEDACTRLGILMDQYYEKSERKNPEHDSMKILTMLELFIALDKLSVQRIPMLADYSPGIRIEWLEQLCLRTTTSLRRLSCAYQYLAARELRSHPGWSVVMDEFSQDSFPVRYYDQSSHLQQLRTRIERATGDTERGDTGTGGAHDNHQERATRLRARDTGLPVSPLPTSSLHAKVVVFELQCPPCFRIWRSAITRIYYYIDSAPRVHEGECKQLADRAELRPYLIDHPGQPRLIYFCPGGFGSGNAPTIRYLVHRKIDHFPGNEFTAWRQPRNLSIEYQSPKHLYRPSEFFGRYTDSTSHTSNAVFAEQVNCPDDFSLDEFIAFGHLRSGGLLQWLNILRGLRSRTLNLRREQVHFLLAHAALQAGPLDLNTATWTWHQELQSPSFCNAIIDELNSLFVDGTGLIDWVFMNNISWLLTRILAWSPSICVSERAILLLRQVRRKTFSWVQDLSYDLQMAPMNEERKTSLLHMALSCRRTFDGVNCTTQAYGQLINCAEDVDALLSCSFFIRVLDPSCGTRDSEIPQYLKLLLERDILLTFTLEKIVKDVVLADPSNRGVDLAIARIFASYRPDALRLKVLQYPSARWLTCNTNTTRSKHSQLVHINLLNGQLRLDGLPFGRLPQEIIEHEDYKRIFDGHGNECFVVPSDLPEMDFMTLVVTSNYKVHFSLRGNNLVVRAQCNQTNQIFEDISSKMKWDLPPALVSDHVHWLNISSGVIEIRHRRQRWEQQSAENWRTEHNSDSYHVYKGLESLVDHRSPTWATLSKCFECVAVEESLWNMRNQTKGILITTSLVDTSQGTSIQQLIVTLPRHALSFFVNDNEELESCDFKHMVYDEDQCIQTLFSLKNLIVLRPKTHITRFPVPEALVARIALILDGRPKHGWLRFRTHMDSDDRYYPATYHTFKVDPELGCLVGNGSPESMRLLAYLHATTSFHKPDPLTGKMGSWAALDALRSAGCRSIMTLKALDDSEDWNWAKYPQLNAVHDEIQQRYYWKRTTSSSKLNGSTSLQWGRAAGRAAHLFPPNWDQLLAKGQPDDDTDVKHELPPIPFPVSYASNQHTPLQITLDQLLSNHTPPELPERNTLSRDGFRTGKAPEVSDDIPPLHQLFASLRTTGNYRDQFQQEYLALLETTRSVVIRKESFLNSAHGVETKYNINTLQKHYAKCRTDYMDAVGELQKTLGPSTDIEKTIEKFGQWPPITPDVLLRCLASTSYVCLSHQWKRYLVLFAQLLLELQRARRLLLFALDDLAEEFSKELENEQCDGWDAEEYPDWLLIQIQCDFLIRRTQAETAMQLMFPQSGGNTVMQVNMGEGKSSVIIPIVAAALADGKQLVRVIVPKALAAQMFDILVARLGGLSNRPIYHVPFSRRRAVDELPVETLNRLMSQCMAERGILLLQPEHVVSLKLTGVEKQISAVAKAFRNPRRSIYQRTITTTSSLASRLLSEDGLVGTIFRQLSQSPKTSTTRDSVSSAPDNRPEWLSFQKWIHSNVRDILDESDEILHPRFQLIYTIGPEQRIDGYPYRWTIIQQVLQLVKEHVHTLSRNHPNSVWYEEGPSGSFPHIRIVRGSDVGPRLISMVVEDVMVGRLPNFCIQQISCAALQDAIRSFISDQDVLQVSKTAKMVEEYANRSHSGYLWNGLLLLRGLLSSDILLFALSERRWRVDYGSLVSKDNFLIPPTMLAIPYQAKDLREPNTRFGHPDLAIILTCLSYYYAGLTKEQLRISFEILLDMDDPVTEYEVWIKGCESLPTSLRKLSDINIRSSEEWDKVTFPRFARNQRAINFYLSRVVFPRDAKEFLWKLYGSSWDLGEKRERLITGFSGTSDSRWLLPMSVVQHDLDHQRGTSVSILAQLLQQEQRKDSENYIVTHENGRRQSALELLRLVTLQLPEIRVLLDVGAQILDLSNEQVAKAWLDVARDAEAAVYCSWNGELTVLTRHGTTQPLASSPLSQQLERCIVYLDHPYTRGTDLKFPIGSRAAVTLGPKLTKDALVQGPSMRYYQINKSHCLYFSGCMRMRKLGRGHTVMFFAPPGVDQSIRAVTGKHDQDAKVTISDVLAWSIQETWADIRHRAPQWAQQGIDHQSRSNALSDFCGNGLTQKQLSDAWLQPNSRSLADLYAPREIEEGQSDLSAVPGVQQRCKQLGILSLVNGQLEEEQEREVNREREREREEELPPNAEPMDHVLHPDVVSFVKTGIIPPLRSGCAFLPVFITLERSTAATRDADVWSPSILATVDFSRTIKPKSTKGTMDQYLRSVQWILSCETDRGPMLVILSPFEANLLIPDIRASKFVHLHLYAPRTANRMRPSDDLKLYAIPSLPQDWTPPWDLIDQLNVFSGQLYLRDYESYLRLDCFLDVSKSESHSDGMKAKRNLFRIPGGLEEMEITFSDSPLPTVMSLLAIRSRGRPFDHTHMGKILRGERLTEKDFDKPKYVIGDQSILPLPLDMGGSMQPGSERSVLPRPGKRGFETSGNPTTVGSSQKRSRAESDETIAASLLPLYDAQDQHRFSRAPKRALKTTDTIQEPQRKRPRMD